MLEIVLKEKSTSTEIICKELNDLFINKNISWIVCATGGDFLLEILPYINYDRIKNNIQNSYDYYEDTFSKMVTGLESFNKDLPVYNYERTYYRWVHRCYIVAYRY